MPILKTQRKNIYEFKSVADMQSFCDEIENAKGNGEFVSLSFSLDDYTAEACDSMVKVAELVASRGYVPEVQVSCGDLEFSTSEIYEFIDCEEKLKRRGLSIYFDDMENLYTIDETIMAYERAKNIIDDIKKYGGSPFEKLIVIYQYITSLIYQENAENKSSSRELVSVLNGEDIVCVGYAKLIEFMCEAVGIDCKRARSDIFDENGYYRSSHQTNLVYIKDEKYGIDGYYHIDACWDSIKAENNGKDMFMNYNFFLLPIKDLKHLKGKMEFYEPLEAIYSENVPEMFFQYYSNPGKVRKFLKYFNVPATTARPDLKMTFEEYKDKKKKALQILTDLFKQNGIKTDIYKSYKKVPDVLKLETLMSLCFDYEKNRPIIDYCIEQMVDHQNNNSNKDKLFNNGYNVRSVYSKIKEYQNTIYDFDEIKIMKDEMVKVSRLNAFFDFMKIARDESCPISLKVFAKALKNVFMTQGYSEKDAEAEAKRALKYSMKRSVRFFDDGAENCFRQTATEKLKQKGE